MWKRWLFGLLIALLAGAEDYGEFLATMHEELGSEAVADLTELI